MFQLVVKVDDRVVAAIDELVAEGEFDSRSDVVRSSLTAFLDERRRAAVGAQILAGYERAPETADELARAEAMARSMIAEEPW
jgi:Arc/MetJ-type ribon-helix-helix transcriptional regulator